MTPGQQRAFIVAVSCWLGGAAWLLVAHGGQGLVLAGGAALLASSLLVIVKLPWGGRVPLAYALLIAMVGAVPLWQYATMALLALLVVAPSVLVRDGTGVGSRTLTRWVVAGTSGGVAVLLLRRALPAAHAVTPSLLVQTVVGGATFLAVDLILRQVRREDAATYLSAAGAWPVYLSLLCGGALLGTAYRVGGWWMAAIAMLPLLLTRFAFDRYAAAQETYRQMIQALSIVPEVAGLSTLGHGERTAAYAEAIALEVGLGPEGVARLTTAARLHHIGAISIEDPEEHADHDDDLDPGASSDIAHRGADMLREVDFLRDVADLIHASPGGSVDAGSLEIAVLRVASQFDDLVGEDAGRAAPAAQLVGLQNRDRLGRQAANALRHLLRERPALVPDAIHAGSPLTRAAAAAVELQYQG